MPPKPPISGAPKITFPHIFFQILAIGTSQKVYKHPHVRVSYPSNENLKKFFSKIFEKIKKIENFEKKILRIFNTWIRNP